jgi:hypothetical protein
MQIRKRSDIKVYPLHIFASFLLFFFILMRVWGFSIYTDATWTLVSYLLVMMPTVALALCAQVIGLDLDSAKSPEQQYFENCKPLYLIMGSVLVFAVIGSIAKSEYSNISKDSMTLLNSVRLLFAGLLASLGFIKKPAFHWVVLSSLFVAVLATASATVFVLQV